MQAVRLELLDLLSEQELDAVLAVELGDLLGELGRAERRHEPVAHLDDRHLEPQHAQRRCDLRSDEAASDDESLPRVLCFRLTATASASVLNVCTAGRSAPGTGSSRGRAPLAITSVPYGTASPPASRTVWASVSTDSTVVSRRNSTARSSYSCGRVDEGLSRLHLAPEDAFREWRPVVGRLVVGRDDGDQRVAALLAVGVDQARGRAAAADDHDRFLGHS